MAVAVKQSQKVVTAAANGPQLHHVFRVISQTENRAKGVWSADAVQSHIGGFEGFKVQSIHFIGKKDVAEHNDDAYEMLYILEAE